MGFLVISLMVGVIGYISLIQLNKVANPLNKNIPESIKAVAEASHLDVLAQLIRYYDEILTQSARNYGFTQDKKWEQRYRSFEPKLDKIIKEAIEKGDERDKEFFSSIDKANLALVKMEYKSIELVYNGQVEEAVNILESRDYWDQKRIYEQGLRNYVHRRGAKYDEALLNSTKTIELATTGAQNLIKTSLRIVLTVTIIALMFAIVIGIYISRSISIPITKLKNATVKIGKGKLDTSVDIKSKDEIGQLAVSFNQMVGDLKKSNIALHESEAKYREQLEKMVKERTTQLEAAQAELVRKERLAVLGQLTATVNHEIRNPLATVKNAVYSIGEAIKSNKMDRVNRSLKLAERNIKRCDRIINELMDFTRIRKIDLEMVDIDSWLSGLLDEQEFPEGIECVRGLHSGIVLPIDRELLRRAVINVVTNAGQALQDGNSMGNQLKVRSAVNGDRLELSFIDTGPGIPEEIMGKIFEPLYSTRSFGIGLGIPIIKNIMQEHHGGIEIKSEPGKGTTITLWLPIPKSEEKDEKAGLRVNP